VWSDLLSWAFRGCVLGSMGVRWGRGVNTLGRDCAGWEAISAPARDGRVDVGGGCG